MRRTNLLSWNFRVALSLRAARLGMSKNEAESCCGKKKCKLLQVQQKSCCRDTESCCRAQSRAAKTFWVVPLCENLKLKSLRITVYVLSPYSYICMCALAARVPNPGSVVLQSCAVVLQACAVVLQACAVVLRTEGCA
jgi:hypothetical protein